MQPPPNEVTQLLEQARSGDTAARDTLLSTLYGELRTLARSYFRKERPSHTLEATALVNEVCLRLLDSRELPGKNRVRFRAFVATAMRHVLIDHARERKRVKRGGELRQVPLDEHLVVEENSTIDLLDLDQALGRLSEVDERKAQVVKLRYFGGLTNREVSEFLDVSLVTVKRDWEVAKTWLHAELKKGRIDSDPGLDV